MNVSDKRIIQFLAKSHLCSFSAMLDVLRYLDRKWIWEDLEYELFNGALGDNEEKKIAIRIPKIRGMTADVLFAFTRHAKGMHMIRRRSRKMRHLNNGSDELVAFYELTPAGHKIIKILEAIEGVLKPKE